MTRQDQEKWDLKYLENIGNLYPSEILKKHISLVPKGNALDIACGNGRNSKFLTEEGFQVDAVDISNVALDQLQGSGINVICQDLDTWEIPQKRYQLIVNIRFLDRRLFPMIKKGLRSGGVLIFESFIDENRDYCLRPNELLNTFTTFHIVYYEEKENDPSDKFKQSVYMVAIK